MWFGEVRIYRCSNFTCFAFLNSTLLLTQPHRGKYIDHCPIIVLQPTQVLPSTSSWLHTFRPPQNFSPKTMSALESGSHISKANRIEIFSSIALKMPDPKRLKNIQLYVSCWSWCTHSLIKRQQLLDIHTYQKPQNHYQYLHFSSEHPCSIFKGFNLFKNHLKAHQYPPTFLKQCCDKVFDSNCERYLTTPKSHTHIVLGHMGRESLMMQGQISLETSLRESVSRRCRTIEYCKQELKC